MEPAHLWSGGGAVPASGHCCNGGGVGAGLAGAGLQELKLLKSTTGEPAACCPSQEWHRRMRRLPLHFCAFGRPGRRPKHLARSCSNSDVSRPVQKSPQKVMGRTSTAVPSIAGCSSVRAAALQGSGEAIALATRLTWLVERHGIVERQQPRRPAAVLGRQHRAGGHVDGTQHSCAGCHPCWQRRQSPPATGHTMGQLVGLTNLRDCTYAVQGRQTRLRSIAEAGLALERDCQLPVLPNATVQ
jgi:hypothetical protein